MTEHKYSLAKKGKHICPACGKKRFVLYIDNETGEPLNSAVGKCDRVDNCAHHYTPRQYFKDNNISPEKKATLAPIPNPTPPLLPTFHDAKLLKQSMKHYEQNNFAMWLVDIVGEAIASKAIERYFVGTSKYSGGATVFWQVDMKYKIRAGKVIVFKDDGHRNQNIMPPVQWIHKLIEIPSFNLFQCFFGEHLLKDTTKPIAIVESEKTAILASVCFPDTIWLASGGSGGINIDKCRCLQGRNVILYPDAKTPDKEGKTLFDKWSEKAKELKKICKVDVSSLIENNATEEERKKGYDLADYLETMLRKGQIKLPDPQPTQTPQPENKSITEPIIGQPKQLVEEVLPVKKETVNFEEDVLELERFFSTATLPTVPIKLNAWTTINDARLFVDNSLTCLRAHYTNKAYLPYLKHLQDFKRYFQK
ncbi:MAG: DUF6371 domain-containing protein [Bacteroidales bacterium]|jgi:hypothetical protein|nr:DUF6371 domain-containing protein [Bacteroidales bacterium]